VKISSRWSSVRKLAASHSANPGGFSLLDMVGVARLHKPGQFSPELPPCLGIGHGVNPAIGRARRQKNVGAAHLIMENCTPLPAARVVLQSLTEHDDQVREPARQHP
jgi:hypothetical protein